MSSCGRSRRSALWVARNLVNARVGRVLRALRESEAAAEAMGVDTAAEKRRVFVLSAVYASVAGSLYAHYITVISPEIYSFLFSVVLVLMVAIGGIGLYWGAVVGAVLLTVLPEALRRFGDWEVPLYGLALIVVILFLPRGIAGLFAGEGRALAPARSSTLPSLPPPSPASAPRAPGESPALARTPVPLLEIRGVTKQFGGVHAVNDVSFRVEKGRSRRSSARTAPGRPRSSTWSPGSPLRRRDRAPARCAGQGCPRIASPPSASPAPSSTSGSSPAHRDRERDGRLRAGRAGRVPRRDVRPARTWTEERVKRRAGGARLRRRRARGAGPAGSLSYGQQRVVEVARALAADPALLLDEPAAGLNIGETVELARLIGRPRRRDHGPHRRARHAARHERVGRGGGPVLRPEDRGRRPPGCSATPR